jgi:hypothetical protein
MIGQAVSTDLPALMKRTFEPSHQVPDKVMTQPSRGREIVSVSSTLHAELKGRAAAAG